MNDRASRSWRQHVLGPPTPFVRNTEEALRRLEDVYDEVGALLREEQENRPRWYSWSRLVRFADHNRECYWEDLRRAIGDAMAGIRRDLPGNDPEGPLNEVALGPRSQNAWLQYRDGHLIALRWDGEQPEDVWIKASVREIERAVVRLLKDVPK